jgi:uncharacterized protein HemX
MSVTEPPVTVAAPVAPVAPPEPMVPEPPARSSTAWLGWLAGLVVVALLAGATAVLFVRVQDAQQQADDATAVATVAGGSQAQLQAQLDQIDQTLTEIQQDGQATRDDVADLASQYTALKKCVNTALDAIAQAGQTGKPVAVTKC